MRFARALSLYPAGLIALSVWTALLPPHDGVLALAQILLPHLCLAALVLVPVLVATRERALAAALGGLVVACAIRLGPEWISPPDVQPDGHALHVVTWNVGRRGDAPADAVIDALLANRPDVVALQELKPDLAAALARDPRVLTAWPFRVLAPDPNVVGMGLLSAFAIEEPETFADPAGVEARLLLGDGRTLSVVTAHPFPGRIGTLPGGVPVTYDGVPRDAALQRLRARIDAHLADGDPLLVLGDFNVAPTEPGYGLLAAGLNDAHRIAGIGPGWTWRPIHLAPLGLGLLRIDYVLGGPTVHPIAARVRCQRVGDHCLVAATVEVP
ncbi:MAG: endonuclease/exonuclease/phosphatase family protein [Pseudomonadota bacterium]|nr:endonuclease/exonuclease/phosphatase family protein [Pseudomonadota bacterium]